MSPNDGPRDGASEAAVDFFKGQSDDMVADRCDLNPDGGKIVRAFDFGADNQVTNEDQGVLKLEGAAMARFSGHFSGA